MATAPAMLSWMSSLADATRARTLRLIERHELTVADLCAVLQLPQSTVSRHLKVLADDGWVAARPEGDLFHRAVDVILSYSVLHYVFVQQPLYEFLDTSLGLLADGGQMLLGDIPNVSKRKRFFSSAAGEWDRLRR